MNTANFGGINPKRSRQCPIKTPEIPKIAILLIAPVRSQNVEQRVKVCIKGEREMYTKFDFTVYTIIAEYCYSNTLYKSAIEVRPHTHIVQCTKNTSIEVAGSN